MSLPRDRNGEGHATEAQFAAAERWAAQNRRRNRNETNHDRWARWHTAEDDAETERFGR